MKNYKYLLTILSTIGLVASFLLMLDTISLIKNPKADLPCNLSPFISCGTAILSEQGEIFGFPNPLLGIISFSVLLTLGVILLTKNDLGKKIMLLTNLGILFSMFFVGWFYFQSLFILGTLCVYCMSVWIVTWPLFIYTTAKNYQDGFLNKYEAFETLSNNQTQIIIIGYLLGALGIFLKFKDYFLA